MIQEYSQLLERAKNDLASTKKFLKLPLLQRVPGFYKIVHEIHAEVFSRIDFGEYCRSLADQVEVAYRDAAPGVRQAQPSRTSSAPAWMRTRRSATTPLGRPVVPEE